MDNKMKINHYAVFIIPLLLLLFCSCIPKYAIHLKTVEFTNIALDKTDFNAKMQVSTKWSHPLTLTDIKYQLYINNNKIGEGEYPKKIVLGENAETLISFPCTIKNQDIALPLIGALMKGVFNFEIEMNLKVMGYIYKKRLKVRYSGTKK
jgi:LEA14-like dessication related protein